jgi:hypothetical protein
MNRIVLFFFMFFSVGILSAQTLFPEVYSCFGGYGENESVQLSWTVGEPLFTTVENDSNILTQGFNQTVIVAEIITGMQDKTGFALNIFPNPASDFINIKFLNERPENLYLFLIDLNGKILLIRKVSSDSEQIDLSVISPGMYLLKITDNQKVTRLFKVQKTK